MLYVRVVSVVCLSLGASLFGCASETPSVAPPAAADRELAATEESAATAAPTSPQPSASSPPPAAMRADGTLKFVSYNVGGLADIVSAGSPSETTPLISPRLNAFDLVVVQEDFEHHKALVSELTLEFQVKPGKASFPKIYGDGLAIFSRLPTGAVSHEEWNTCSGTFGGKNDCLAEKGFRCVVVTLEPNVEVDVCSLHMDAGRGGDDAAARDKQASQLATYLEEHAKDRAIIVGGDTNMKASDEASMVRLLALTSLRDTCRELKCPQPELHDRVLVRDAARLQLTPANWRVATNFKTASGEPLSDHDPVAVDISWTKR